MAQSSSEGKIWWQISSYIDTDAEKEKDKEGKATLKTPRGHNKLNLSCGHKMARHTGMPRGLRIQRVANRFTTSYPSKLKIWRSKSQLCRVDTVVSRLEDTYFDCFLHLATPHKLHRACYRLKVVGACAVP
jgi:hypothetical protein